MKKFAVILSNVVLILLILFAFEYYLHIKERYLGLNFIHVSNFCSPPMDEIYDEILKNGFYGEGNSQGVLKFRRPVYQNTNLKPIVVFGCSFAWGVRLYEHQTFHYLLSRLMNRTVYNRAIIGWGVQHMLYQVKREDFYREVPEPEYVIFVYISNHVSRLYKYNSICNACDYNYLKYNNVFGKLKEEKRLQNIPYSRIYNDVILREIAYVQELKLSDTAFSFLEKHFIESKKEMEKHWKNTKFVILDYESEDNHFSVKNNVLNDKNIKKLEKDGFTVITTRQLTDEPLDDRYYLDENDGHPNAKAWALITPLFVEKLKKL